MNALESLLRPLARLLNRRIATQTPARELCASLAGRVVAVRVRHSALAMYFFIETGGVRLSGGSTDEPDVVITGSLVTLATIAGRSGEAAVRDGSLEITGDAEVARAFQRLLVFARPDLEEELSGIVGDTVAHGVGRFARGVAQWGREARSTLSQNLGEYLQEERRSVPSRAEADTFRHDVETLRDDVARLEARLARLESGAGSRNGGSR